MSSPATLLRGLVALADGQATQARQVVFEHSDWERPAAPELCGRGRDADRRRPDPGRAFTTVTRRPVPTATVTYSPTSTRSGRW